MIRDFLNSEVIHLTDVLKLFQLQNSDVSYSVVCSYSVVSRENRSNHRLMHYLNKVFLHLHLTGGNFRVRFF